MCEEFAPRDGTTRLSGEGGANRAFEIAAGGRCRRGKCVKNLLPGTEPQGLVGGGSKSYSEKGRRRQQVARKLCEGFAPRNGAARVSEERGANRGFEIAAGGSQRRGKCVKILLPGTEPQGLARSGEQTAPGKSRPAPGVGAGNV